MEKSEFGYYTTAEEAARDTNLQGKNVIITGANSGMYYPFYITTEINLK